jgi:hypothetical protein
MSYTDLFLFQMFFKESEQPKIWRILSSNNKTTARQRFPQATPFNYN